jgi:hypothetical protein
MRFSELCEAPVPTAMQDQRFYHGTETRTAADSILRVGLRPGMTTSYKGDLRPAANRVYLTTDLDLALVHALGSGYRRRGANEFGVERAYGYVFVVLGKDLLDADPDEDAIGEFLWMQTTGTADHPIFDAHHQTESELRQEIWTFIMQHGRKRDLRDSLTLGPKRPGGWAALGKMLQPIMPDWMKAKLIEWGGHIAHAGVVRPSECWRISRRDVPKLIGPANFFELAERIR